MVRLTLIARVADGLPRAEGLDSDKEHDLDVYKSQAKVATLAALWLRVAQDPYIFEARNCKRLRHSAPPSLSPLLHLPIASGLSEDA